MGGSGSSPFGVCNGLRKKMGRTLPRVSAPVSSTDTAERFFQMRKVNLKDIPEQEKKSPKGKFNRFMKNVSIALGREPESLDLSKRHPFDLALVRVPKGKFMCPYHAHQAKPEL